MKAADSLTEPLAMPAVYFSCFGTGTEFGDSGPLMSSATCFSELWELFCFDKLEITKLVNFGINFGITTNDSLFLIHEPFFVNFKQAQKKDHDTKR